MVKMEPTKFKFDMLTIEVFAFNFDYYSYPSFCYYYALELLLIL